MLDVIFLIVSIDDARRLSAVDGVAQAIREDASGVMPASPQQLVSGRDFNEDGDVPTGCDRHSDERHLYAEQLEELIVEPEPLVFPSRIPPFEVDGELDAFRRSGGGDATQF